MFDELQGNRMDEDWGKREDKAMEEIKRLDMLLEYAVQHGDEAEAESDIARA